MKQFAFDLARYLKTVFGESWQWVLTFFDLLGISLFLFPSAVSALINNEAIARTVGGVVFLTSFLIANFFAFRKLFRQNEELTEHRISLEHHAHQIYNAIKMHHAGHESVENIEVTALYVDNQGQAREDRISEFFSSNDIKMNLMHFTAYTLEPNEIVYFRLPKINLVPAGKATVRVRYTGMKSGKPGQLEKEFKLPL